MGRCYAGFNIDGYAPCRECGAGPSDGCHREADQLRADLAAANQRIAELTSVSDEAVERAAMAWVDEHANYEIIGVTGENLPFKVFRKDSTGPIASFVGKYRECVAYIRTQAIRAALEAFVSSVREGQQ